MFLSISTPVMVLFRNEFIDGDNKSLSLPYLIDIRLPIPDSGRGYSKQLISNLALE